MLKNYEIRTLEGTKEVDLREYEEQAESEAQAIRYAVAEIISDAVLNGHHIDVIEKQCFTHIHIWDDIETGEDLLITVWAREKR